MNRNGQLFLIEVIIALSVMIVLISTLFAVQSYSPPTTENNLDTRGEEAISVLVESGLMWDYFDAANRSYFELDQNILDSSNVSKSDLINTIDTSLPLSANFKAFTSKYNSTSNDWIQIDIVNFETVLPSGSDIVTVEYYTPGYNGFEVEVKFQLMMWFEVN